MDRRGLVKGKVVEPDEYRILLVDDEVERREMMREVLELNGKYKITEAGDGLEAWTLVTQEPFDLVITDVVMPRMDGLELLKKVRDNLGDIPIIVATGQARDIGAQSLAEGADDCIYLPFHVDEFQFRVGRTLRFHQLLKARDLLIKENQALWNHAITDKLTGLFNRQYFEEKFNEEFARSNRYKSDLACLMIDIDHFKQINDDYGHLVGDVVLRELGVIVQNTFRKIDFAFRYGGEEFVILLPQTHRDGTKLVAERLRERVADFEFCKELVLEDMEMRQVTISVGCAHFPDERYSTAIELLKAADEQLYAAKHGGRNRVQIAW